MFILFSVLAHETEDTPKNIVIVRTVDGRLSGLNGDDGNTLWTINDDPRVVQNISNLLFTSNNSSFKFIPSFDGTLFAMNVPKQGAQFQHSNPYFDVVSVPPEDLLSSKFRINTDELVSGERRSSIYAFDPLTGKIIYDSSKPGCNPADTKPHSNEGRIIVVKQLSHKIRASHFLSGKERWNFAVSDDELFLVNTPTGQQDLNYDNFYPKSPLFETRRLNLDNDSLRIEMRFNVITGSVLACVMSPSPKEFWQNSLDSSIVKAWIYNVPSNQLLSVSVLQRDAIISQRRPVNDFQAIPNALLEGDKKRAGKDTMLFYQTEMNQNSLATITRPNIPSDDQQLAFLGSHESQLYLQSETSMQPTYMDNHRWLGFKPSKSYEDLEYNSFSLLGYYWTNAPHIYAPHSSLPLITEAPSILAAPRKISNAFKGLFSQHIKGLRQCFSRDYEVNGPTMNYPEILGEIIQNLGDKDQFIGHETPILVHYHILTWTPQVISVLILILTLLQLTWCVKRPNFSYQRRKRSISVSSTLFDRSINDQVICGTDGSGQVTEFTSVFEQEFKFRSLIGIGGFGRVFEVENIFDGCHYAVKRIRLRPGQDLQMKFIREVKAMASLDHPGIVRYHRAWIEYSPEGWQEARDRELLQEDYTKDAFSTTKLTSSPDLPSKTHQTTRQWNSLLDSLKRPQPICSITFRDSTVEKKMENTSSSSVDSDSSTPIQGQQSAASAKPLYACYMYIQMQLCSRQSLRDWLVEHPKVVSRLEVSSNFFLQIVQAVDYLHSRGYMHRDLKPSNILFDLEGRIKLADFGLVTTSCAVTPSFNDSNQSSVKQTVLGRYAQNPLEADTDGAISCNEDVSIEFLPRSNDGVTGASWGSSDVSSASGGQSDSTSEYDVVPDNISGGTEQFNEGHTSLVGTDLYMSPEQASSRNYDEKVDIFSLGLIYFELIFPLTTAMERVMKLSDAKAGHLPASFLKNFPREAAFCQQLLRSSPSQRPTANQILNDSLFTPTKMTNSAGNVRLRRMSS